MVYIEPICLSYEYALPNKLFESIQAGIPIVGSNLIEIKNIVEGLDVGFCFSTPEDMAKEIHENVTKKRIANWRERIDTVREELCWDVEQLRLVEAYNSFER